MVSNIYNISSLVPNSHDNSTVCEENLLDTVLDFLKDTQAYSNMFYNTSHILFDPCTYILNYGNSDTDYTHNEVENVLYIKEDLL